MNTLLKPVGMSKKMFISLAPYLAYTAKARLGLKKINRNMEWRDTQGKWWRSDKDMAT